MSQIDKFLKIIAEVVYGLAKLGNYTHKSPIELLMFNKSTDAQ